MRQSKAVCSYLGNLIALARKERNMTSMELCDRVGMIPETLDRIESGDSRIEIGYYIDCCSMVGINLLHPNPDSTTISSLLGKIVTLIPEPKTTKRIVDDNF